MKLIVTFDCTITADDIKPLADELENSTGVLNVEIIHCGNCSDEIGDPYTGFIPQHKGDIDINSGRGIYDCSKYKP